MFDLTTLTIQTIDDSGKKRIGLTGIFAFNAQEIAEKNKNGAGIYFTINPQENLNERGIENTKEFKRFGLDLDVTKEKQHLTRKEIDAKKLTLIHKLKSLPIAPNYIIDTKNGLQPLWIFKNGKSLETVDDRIKANELYKQIVSGFTKVTGLKSEGDSITRVLRFPGTNHLKTPNDPFKISIEEFNSEPVHFEEFIKTYPPVVESNNNGPRISITDAIGLRDGDGRNTILHDLACSFIMRDGTEKAWIAIQRLNETGERLSEGELRTLFKSAESWTTKQAPNSKREAPGKEWPKPLAPEAFHGIVGDLVRAIMPHTEADEAAILINNLAAFGNIIGDKAHFRHEANRHTGRLFIVLVGPTGEGLKGTSFGYTNLVFNMIEPGWESKVQSGLGSGEALVYAVRDPVYKKNKSGIEKESDPGVTDKRAVFVFDEFSALLTAMARQGSTLSSIIRRAWDTGNLQNLVKNNPLKATGAHITLFCHITPDELQKCLSETDMTNGFANRFLWICTKRSKFLPRGGNLKESTLTPIIEKFKQAVDYAKNIEEVVRSEAAWQLWDDIYPALSKQYSGLLGSLTSRAKAYATRLSMLYALLDKSDVVEPEHLMAALAVWNYSIESVKYIFQSQTGDAVANRIYKALVEKADIGMTRTQISEFLGKNVDSERILIALETLKDEGLIIDEKKATGGANATVWKAVRI